ncbi:hypothetical protein [Shewanella surugensis]|uniref:Cytochrome c family protein n=1 Tax=Shewanella surugensis TaxID=212020 RepID=A0ABT0LGW4_9GAMM|nr:hypothetical protein [Shewanella surugensis]MCL1126905.1 hypothetical protein [Shewanella surugensis]
MKMKLGLLFLCLNVMTACTQDNTNKQNVNKAVSESGSSQSPLLAYCQFPASAPTAGANQKAFDDYSWQMFLSLNWVNSQTQRGVPDCDKALDASGPRVWESWKTTSELFLPNAAAPGDWNSGWDGVNTPPKLSATSKVAKRIQAALEAEPKGSGILQAVGGWLIDQRGNPTYYQIASNEISYNYIVSNQLYNADTVKAFNPVNFPWETAEIKASWRILTNMDDDTRYLTLTALVEEFDAQGKSKHIFTSQTLGLVGLHIINKPEGFPQWVWATFEQVDNVDDKEAFASYYNASATNPNQSPCQPSVIPCTPKEGASFTTPDPLTRLTPIAAETLLVNQTFQGMLTDSVLQYYQLVTTQRPNNPNDPGDPLGTPEPNIAANVTMESYIQESSNCMACHQTASGIDSLYHSDFSFMLLNATQP